MQKCRGYLIRLTRNARSGKVSSSHCYVARRPLHDIATFDGKHSQQLIALSRVILIRYLILYACEDHGTDYEFYLKKFKKMLYICLILITH